MEEIIAVFSGIIIFGLLHGINPSHGWTVAVLYSLQSKRPLLSSILSSGILASAHFLSSIVVVLAFILFSTYIHIPQNYLNYAAAIALAILAYMFWREKPEDLVNSQHGHLHQFSEEIKHDHSHWHKDEGFHNHLHTHQIRTLPSLSALAISALILGFAHEEEFVILSLAAAGVNPALLMIVYALSVSVALIGITILSVKIITTIQDRIIHYTKYLPKVSAIILAIMAIAFGLGLV
ncbi:MAG TPA: nickel/cobalt transporter [Nitrososphaeraceae archaeon]|nr:nickel/cobalt transporter [Nitrososphaeraceae archaeon]